MLFFHFIFRPAAPVSSFLFVFGSYYSWLLPVFWFPSLALIRMFILPACFCTFPRCLPVRSRAESTLWVGSELTAPGSQHNSLAVPMVRGCSGAGRMMGVHILFVVKSYFCSIASFFFFLSRSQLGAFGEVLFVEKVVEMGTECKRAPPGAPVPIPCFSPLSL